MNEESTGRSSSPWKSKSRDIALGAGAGMIFGAALGNAAVGMVLGACAGLAIGSVWPRQR